MSHYLNENNCRLTNKFEGKGLKHYGCEFFSAIIHHKRIDAGIEGNIGSDTCIIQVWGWMGWKKLVESIDKKQTIFWRKFRTWDY